MAKTCFSVARALAVLKWINKYVALMKVYVDKMTPNVSDVWRADELYVKIKGDMKYLFALMDDETRFWIAQEVAETKYKHDARKLFQLGVVDYLPSGRVFIFLTAIYLDTLLRVLGYKPSLCSPAKSLRPSR